MNTIEKNALIASTDAYAALHNLSIVHDWNARKGDVLLVCRPVSEHKELWALVQFDEDVQPGLSHEAKFHPIVPYAYFSQFIMSLGFDRNFPVKYYPR